MTFTYDFAHD
jgi:cytosolic carboxypeptidase protein 2/3